MEYMVELKQRVIDQKIEIEYLKSLLNSFWTGDIPQDANLDHMRIAKYGRMRLEDISKIPALLVK